MFKWWPKWVINLQEDWLSRGNCQESILISLITCANSSSLLFWQSTSSLLHLLTSSLSPSASSLHLLFTSSTSPTHPSFTFFTSSSLSLSHSANSSLFLHSSDLSSVWTLSSSSFTLFNSLTLSLLSSNSLSCSNTLRPWHSVLFRSSVICLSFSVSVACTACRDAVMMWLTTCNSSII